MLKSDKEASLHVIQCQILIFSTQTTLSKRKFALLKTVSFLISHRDHITPTQIVDATFLSFLFPKQLQKCRKLEIGLICNTEDIPSHIKIYDQRRKEVLQVKKRCEELSSSRLQSLHKEYVVLRVTPLRLRFSTIAIQPLNSFHELIIVIRGAHPFHSSLKAKVSASDIGRHSTFRCKRML